MSAIFPQQNRLPYSKLHRNIRTYSVNKHQIHTTKPYYRANFNLCILQNNTPDNTFTLVLSGVFTLIHVCLRLCLVQEFMKNSVTFFLIFLCCYSVAPSIIALNSSASSAFSFLLFTKAVINAGRLPSNFFSISSFISLI